MRTVTILLILAIVAGLAASYMVSQRIAQEKEEVVVLIAKRALPKGGTIDPDDFEQVVVLKKNAAPNPVNSDPGWQKKLKGKRLNRAIAVNAILTEDHIAAKDE